METGTEPVEVTSGEVTSDKALPPVPALPSHVQFAGWGQTNSDMTLRDAYANGYIIPFDVTTDAQYGKPQSGEYTHLIKKVSASVRVTSGRSWSRAHGTTVDALPARVRITGTWKCGNQSNNAVILPEPDGLLCPACHGTPNEKAPRTYTPSVHALPLMSEVRCQAQVLLPGSVRRCSRPAAWRWANTPTCHHHLNDIRIWWLGEQEKRLG